MVKSLARRPEGGMAIVDISEPLPKPGDVLVDVAFSAVNDMDVGVRAGEWKEYVDAFLANGPTVTGFEFTGIAASDGKRIRRGDRVAGYTHVLSGPRTHARRIAVSEDDLTILPAKVGFAEGAALISMGLTAIEILEGLKPLSPNSRVLVLGAAGGVGVYCVQLAKRQGAKVTAFCSAANADWIRGQGADEVRPYETTSPFAAGDAFDLVVDAPAKWTFLESQPFLAADGM
jgi:NADPH2:quinone reductase